VDPLKSIAVPVTRRSATQPRKRKGPAGLEAGDNPGIGAFQRQPAQSANAPVHLYQIGQRLAMAAGSREFSRTASLCQVIALLPHERGPLRYRVRSDTEGFERIVDETDLSPIK
jgi:hypothetical protein